MGALDHPLGVGQELREALRAAQALTQVAQHRQTGARCGRSAPACGRAAAGEGGGDLVGRALALDPAVGEQHHPVGDAERAQAMGHHDDRCGRARRA